MAAPTAGLLWLVAAALLAVPSAAGPQHVRQTSAMERLLRVFGLEHHRLGRRERHSAPPQYMLDLYNTIADQRSGVTIHDNPYHADVVRSYPDTDSSQHHLHFYFNVLQLEAGEKLLEAEFHVFKLKPRSSSKLKARSHLLEMRVYQVMNSTLAYQEEGNKMLDARRISTHATGWEVFHVRDAVASWLSNVSSNFGLLVSLRTLAGDPAEDSTLRVVKRRHPNGRQPILVLFTSDGRKKPPQLRENDSELQWNSVNNVHVSMADPVNSKTTSTRSMASRRIPVRHRRSLESPSSSSSYSSSLTTTAPPTTNTTPTAHNASSAPLSSDECSRHELYVNFEQIGWASWIISPQGYNAHYCSGSCSFPLGQNQRPTNHATVQSIVHELGLHVGIRSPCCVPNKLLSINLLYFDEHSNVVFKRYDDMVAASCGCH